MVGLRYSYLDRSGSIPQHRNIDSWETGTLTAVNTGIMTAVTTGTLTAGKQAYDSCDYRKCTAVTTGTLAAGKQEH